MRRRRPSRGRWLLGEVGRWVALRHRGRLREGRRRMHYCRRPDGGPVGLRRCQPSPRRREGRRRPPLRCLRSRRRREGRSSRRRREFRRRPPLSIRRRQEGRRRPPLRRRQRRECRSRPPLRSRATRTSHSRSAASREAAAAHTAAMEVLLFARADAPAERARARRRARGTCGAELKRDGSGPSPCPPASRARTRGPPPPRGSAPSIGARCLQVPPADRRAPLSTSLSRHGAPTLRRLCADSAVAAETRRSLWQRTSSRRLSGGTAEIWQESMQYI
jgi:hypothetical protein